MLDIRIRLEDQPGFSASGRHSFGIDNGNLGFFSGTGLPPGWINVADYGAIGNGIHNDTSAIQAAISAAGGATGIGVVYFPPGIFNFTALDVRDSIGTITLRGCQGYQWWGNGGTASQGQTILNCISTGSNEGISCFQIQGLIIQDIQFQYVEGYSGVLLQLGGAGGVGSNTIKVSQCHFIADNDGTYATAKCFIGIRNSVCVTIEDCTFAGAQSLIRGAESPADFSNDIFIIRCVFERCTVGQIVNPWLQWYIRDCSFEFTGVESGLNAPYGITADSAVFDNGINTTFIEVSGCNFWDAQVSGLIPIHQPKRVSWDIRIDRCWFYLFQNANITLNGTGSCIVTDCSFQSNVPVSTPTLIDFGNSADGGKKDFIKASGLVWNVGNTTENASTIINYTGHGNNAKAVLIGNNINLGPWSTDNNALFAWVHVPSAVVLNDSNSTLRYLGGTMSIGVGVSEGSFWELHAESYTGLQPTLTLPAGYEIYADGTPIAAGKTSLTVTAGMVRLTKTTPDATGGFAAGLFNLEVHGSYTLAP